MINQPLYEAILKVLQGYDEAKYLETLNAYLRLNGKMTIWKTDSHFNELCRELEPIEIVTHSHLFKETDPYFMVLYSEKFIGLADKTDCASYIEPEDLAKALTENEQSVGNPDIQGVIDRFHNEKVINEIIKTVKSLQPEEIKTVWNSYCDSIDMARYYIFDMTEIYKALKLWNESHITEVVASREGEIRLTDKYFIIRPEKVDSSNQTVGFIEDDEYYNVGLWLYDNKNDFGIYELSALWERYRNLGI